MTETADLYVSCLRPLCFTLSTSMFHACGLYLRHMATIRGGLRSGAQGSDYGRLLCFVALRGGLANNGAGRWACKQRGWEAGLKHRGWVRAFGARAFRGSCFWSFFSWFVLLGSCFWSFLLLVRAFGGSYVFLFDALKFLEACVARSEVSKCKDSKKFAAMQIFTSKISCSPFGFSVVQGHNNNSHKRLRAFVGRRENAFRFLSFIFNLQYVYGMFHCGLHKMFCFIQEKTQLSVSMWSLRSLVISHFRKKNVPNCSLYKYIYLNIYLYRG